ncbi:MAG: hypothetical protein AB1689_28855 [Thermodesulfobacteriota bacterium]
MVDVKVENNKLALTLEGLDKLWAMKSRLEIPLANVSAVRADPTIAKEKGRTGLKLTGARLGERLIAGSFRQDGRTVFWDVHDPAKAIVVDLHDEHYAQLIVEVEDPAATVARVQAALAAR